MHVPPTTPCMFIIRANISNVCFMYCSFPQYSPPFSLLSYHHGVGVWARGRSEDVMRRLHIGHPVPDGLGRGVLERGRARVHGSYLSTHQPHAEDVQRLALHVLGEGGGWREEVHTIQGKRGEDTLKLSRLPVAWAVTLSHLHSHVTQSHLCSHVDNAFKVQKCANCSLREKRPIMIQ